MSRKGSAAVHGCVGRESAAKARRSFDAHPHAFEVGSDHRSRGRFGADVDGHDDAAAGRGVAAVQADFLCSRRWLDVGSLIKLWNIERARRQAALFARIRRSSTPFLMERLRTAQRYASDNS